MKICIEIAIYKGAFSSKPQDIIYELIEVEEEKQ